MSVLPVVGSELPTDSDAAVVVTEYVDDVRGDTLDAVDEHVGRSCVRLGSAEVWPDLHDERSVMSFLVRPVAVFLSYEVGDDRFSPVVGSRVPFPCPVDSLCMLLGCDIRKAKAGPLAEVWDWRSVLCGIAHSSQLPELPNSDGPDSFRDIGMTYVLNLSVSPVGSPGGGLETVPRSPPLPYCRVAELMSISITIGRGCTRMRGCAGNGHSPGEIKDVGRVGVPRTEMTCAENSGLTAMCVRKEKVRFGRDTKYVRGMMGVPRTEMC